MNTIVVMSDSFRRDHIGAFGNDWIRTPHLDRFAGQSTAFPRFTMGSYATIPQRTDLFTGLYSFADRPWQPLKPEDVVLTELLRDAGVDTYASADTPHLFRSAQLTFMRGFDGFHWTRGSEGEVWWTDWYAERAYEPPTGKGRIRISEKAFRGICAQRRRRYVEMDWQTPQTFQAAIEWLNHNSRRDGFFLYIDTFDPHEPWDPPDWLRDLYCPDPKVRPFAWAEYGSVKQFAREQIRLLQGLYAAECTMVDRWFGRLVETVDLLGLGESTMVVFLSDHGHYLGYPNDFGRIGKAPGVRRADGKGCYKGDGEDFSPLLDSISNPPLLVRMPGQSRPRTCSAPAQPVDLTPTVLDLHGAAAPEGLHGRSLLPLLGGEKRRLRPHAVTACHGQFAQITDARWLYGAWQSDSPPRLFDRKSDPNQTRDVLQGNAAVAARLHRKLMGELQKLRSPSSWVALLDASRKYIPGA